MSVAVADWRSLRRGDLVKVLDPLVGSEKGVVERVEPCLAADSAWVYVDNSGPVLEMVLMIDGHTPKLEVRLDG